MHLCGNMNMKKSIEDISIEKAEQAYADLLKPGQFTTGFSRVDRNPRYQDGRRESDVEYSFHLMLSATELAADYYPDLDAGLVAQFSAVHDLPEYYTGDTWSFDISDEARYVKELAEKRAVERLLEELPSYTAQLLKRYKKQVEPEARFVRFVDKLMPEVIRVIASDTSTFEKDHNITSIEELMAIHNDKTAKFKEMFPEFDLIHLVRNLVVEDSTDRCVLNRR